MLSMDHFDKTMSITTEGPPTDKWINNLHIVGIKTIKCHVTSSKQIFAIYPRLN